MRLCTQGASCCVRIMRSSMECLASKSVCVLSQVEGYICHTSVADVKWVITCVYTDYKPIASGGWVECVKKVVLISLQNRTQPYMSGWRRNDSSGSPVQESYDETGFLPRDNNYSHQFKRHIFWEKTPVPAWLAWAAWQPERLGCRFPCYVYLLVPCGKEKCQIFVVYD